VIRAKQLHEDQPRLSTKSVTPRCPAAAATVVPMATEINWWARQPYTLSDRWITSCCYLGCWCSSLQPYMKPSHKIIVRCFLYLYMVYGGPLVLPTFFLIWFLQLIIFGFCNF